MTASINTPGPRSVLPRRPLQWLTVFGPGAIIASLTIGTGELIFSSRGGAIFGYRVLLTGYVDETRRWYAIGALFGMLMLGLAGGYFVSNWRRVWRV